MKDFNKEVLMHYKNGDYKVILFTDGTKVRMSSKENPKPAFPENIDIKLTDRCNFNCPFCHENSTSNGKTIRLLDWDGCFYNQFLYSLPTGTEVALGGGALTTIEHEEFSHFLNELYQSGVIANATINQREIPGNNHYLGRLLQNHLIHGLGVSYNGLKFDEFLDFCVANKDRVVIHVINGIFNEEDYEYLKDRGLKILILGYKDIRRGKQHKEAVGEIIAENQKWLSENIMEIKRHFDTVSFDNLAVSQLDMKSKVSEEVWEKYYMGDDGTHTMYIDLPNQEFSVSSTYEKRWKIEGMKIQDMFKTVRDEVCEDV